MALMKNGTSCGQKRAAIYCRVSTERQEDEGTSLDTQEQRCREYAASKGYTVVAVYREVYSGAEKDERPQLSLMRESVRRRELDVVLAYAVDRLSRDQVHIYVIWDELQRHNVRMEFVTETFEETAVGKFLLSAKTFAAEVEREKIRERSMRGKLAKVRGGMILGVGPVKYGYQWRYAPPSRPDGKPRRVGLDENPETAPIVRRIFGEVARGVPLNQIVSRLMAESVPTPGGGRAWYPSTVCQIVRDPAYSGNAAAFRYYKKNKIAKLRPEDQHIPLPAQTVPPLADGFIQQAALERLEYNKMTATRHCSDPEAFLLRAGFVFCGYCGARMAACVSRNGALKQYCCKNSGPTGVCSHRPAIVAAQLDEGVWLRITRSIQRRDFVESLIAQANETGEADSLAVELAEAQRKLNDVQRKQRNLLGQLENLDPEASGPHLERLAILGAQRKNLEAELTAILARQEQARQSRVRYGDVARWCEIVAANLASFDYHEKRRALLALGVKVTVWRTDHEPRWDVEAIIPLEPRIVTETY